MCGICGIFDPGRRLDAIGAMNQIQRHRGPDDEGYLFVDSASGRCWAAGGDDTMDGPERPHHESRDVRDFDLALGSRRLAILDLSPAGWMPMSFDGDRLWITYNGEVYNHRELKDTLRSLGHRFRTGTDTEVILAAYAEWGEQCVRRFNGMWAFALWDARRRRLFCARDHFGIKPFYYHWDGELFVFASEIKALLQHPLVPRIPDEHSIFDYLVLGLSDHDDRTFFEGVVPLQAGWWLTLDVPERLLTTRRYWEARVNPEVAWEPLERERRRTYADFAGLLEDAVRLRLRSDVPLGSCLSGGLDSSSIVVLANRLLLNEQVIPARLVGDHQKTFTARNREEEIDEYAYSRLVVQQTGADEHVVFPEGEALWQDLDALAWHMDQPFGSTSPYQQWSLMRLARQGGVTVLLDGQGGDELLAGYHSYLPVYVRQIAQCRGFVSALRAGCQVSRNGGAPAFDSLYRDFAARLPWRAQQTLLALRPVRPGPGASGSAVTDRQLTPEFVSRHRDRLWRPPVADGDGLAGVLYRDVISGNLPMLLRYEDRNSMAFSLETRLPFLDPRLVEFVFSLPLEYRIHDGWTKWILRRSLSETLPAQVCWRRSKLGFPTPERRWLAQGSPQIRRVLEHARGSQLATFVRRDALARAAEQPDGEIASTPGIWRLFGLGLWLELFFDGRGEAVATRLSGRRAVSERRAAGRATRLPVVVNGVADEH